MGASNSQFGYRVLKVHAHGPSGKTDLVPFMDYIVAADGKLVTSDESVFVRTIKQHHAAATSLTLSVHNILSGLQRDVVIQPNSTWGGEGLLGLVIRYDTLKQADEHCIHVLDVFPRSPAHKAGLISYEDYLLGTDDTVLKSYEDLEKLLSAQKTVTLVVFNAINRGVRDVLLQPSQWEGQGLLGCNIGHGWLHRLPLHSSAAVAAALEQSSEKIEIEVDETGTISFLISVLVQDTDQMITLPVVIFPTDFSMYDYQQSMSVSSDLPLPPNSEYFEAVDVTQSNQSVAYPVPPTSASTLPSSGSYPLPPSRPVPTTAQLP